MSTIETRRLLAIAIKEARRLRKAIKHILAAHNGNPVLIHYKVREAIDAACEVLSKDPIEAEFMSLRMRKEAARQHDRTAPNELPKWYLDEARPRLKRLDDLSPVAYPDVQPQDVDGLEEMQRARREWDQLMREQTCAEVNAGL